MLDRFRWLGRSKAAGQFNLGQTLRASQRSHLGSERRFTHGPDHTADGKYSLTKIYTLTT